MAAASGMAAGTVLVAAPGMAVDPGIAAVSGEVAGSVLVAASGMAVGSGEVAGSWGAAGVGVSEPAISRAAFTAGVWAEEFMVPR